jgi:hypothetical protein
MMVHEQHYNVQNGMQKDYEGNDLLWAYLHRVAYEVYVSRHMEDYREPTPPSTPSHSEEKKMEIPAPAAPVPEETAEKKEDERSEKEKKMVAPPPLITPAPEESAEKVKENEESETQASDGDNSEKPSLKDRAKERMQ